MVGVRGRAEDRVNHGRLGPKGLYGWQGELHDRLTRPMIRKGSELIESSWDEAMNLITSRSRELLDSKGPLSHGFYTSGQLMLEEYYTLAVIGKAGIGTPHMDGNTRLCTATAAASLKESFGADGQPGSYADLDVCEALFCFGHNVAATQTVLWSRILDRLAGSDPPHLVAVDPRLTSVAEGGRDPSCAAARHESRLGQWPAAAVDLQRVDRPGLHRSAHQGLRRAGIPLLPITRRLESPRSAVWRRGMWRRRPRSSVPHRLPCRRFCRASINRIRRRRLQSRSTTCICCGACSVDPAPASCR